MSQAKSTGPLLQRHSLNPEKYSCHGLKKIHTWNLIAEKNFCGWKVPLPPPLPHNFSNGLSLNIFHETMSNLFNLLIQRVQTVGRQRDKNNLRKSILPCSNNKKIIKRKWRENKWNRVETRHRELKRKQKKWTVKYVICPVLKNTRTSL